MLFRKKENITPEWLIVGLGNPGRKYVMTRHNAGFLCIDFIAERLGVDIGKKMFDSKTAFCKIAEKDCLLMKPQTFMNASGDAVIQAVEKYGIPPERVLVIADDISFGVGSVRIRKNGSSGGQKGVNSIIETLGTQNFPRIKVGAGKRPEDVSTVDWVLSLFAQDETESLNTATVSVANAVEEIVRGNFELAMSKYNKTV